MLRSLVLIVGLLLLGIFSSAEAEKQRFLYLRSDATKTSHLPPTHYSRRQLEDDDDPWPIGTKVYYQFEDGWYEGTITDFDEMGYTITWEDDTKDIDDFTDDEVDMMVDNYQRIVVNGEPAPAPTPADDAPTIDDAPAAAPTADDDDTWPIGTNVYYEFEGDGWYVGTITDFDEFGYTITWEDKTEDVDDFTDEEVDQMVANYQAMCDTSGSCTAPAADDAPAAAPTADDDDTWPIGTKVYQGFDDGWYQGTITDWDDTGYTIEWEDGSVDVDDWDDDEVDQMVANYQNMCESGECTPPEGDGGDDEDDDSWPVGTRVYMQFDDGWYAGTITDYDEDGYTITWDDGSVDYDDFTDEQVDQAVEDYKNMGAAVTEADSAGGGGKSGLAPGAIFVIVAIVLFAFVGVWYFVRRRRFGKEEAEELSPSNMGRTRDFS